MINRKFALACIMVLVVLAMQVGAAYAAPISQATTIDGTVESITQSTDSSGNIIFIVEIKDTSGNTQTVRLSAADAAGLGLVTDNLDGTFTINDVVGTTISIPSDVVIADPCSSEEKGIVAMALSAFFCQGGSTVLDSPVDTLHADGYGFGEIAQACFMAEALGTTCGDILSAKSSHDYSTLGLPTDVSNWGQLKKYAMGQEIKSLTNLGAIMSGRATAPSVGPTPAPTPTGPMIPNANGNGNNGHGHGPGGNGKGNGNGHGHKP